VTALAIPNNQNMEANHEQDESSGNSVNAGHRSYRDDGERVRQAAGLADVHSSNVPVLRDKRPDEQSKVMEANHESEISKGVSARPNIRNVDSNRSATGNGVVEPKAVNPVPHLSLVNPVPYGSTKARASGSTSRKKGGSTRELHPVPQFKGYKWKPSGLTGWELYTRKPSISRNGKRSSKGKYLGYYSQEAVRILYAATQKAADARRA